MEYNTINCGNSGLRQKCVASEKSTTAVSLVVSQFQRSNKLLSLTSRAKAYSSFALKYVISTVIVGI